MPFVKRRGRGAAEWWETVLAGKSGKKNDGPEACAPVRPEGSFQIP